MKKVFPFCFFTLLAFTALSQKRDYIWVFDEGIQLDFNSLTPSVSNTGLHGIGMENYASVSSDSGNLLFHINGNDSIYSLTNTYEMYFSDAYDRNHILMPNGDSLLSDFSSTQGTLIIPFPADSNQYYVFNLNTIPLPFTGYAGGLYYSVIDMTLNNGNGDVTYKNQNLYTDTIVEKLSACRHGNGRDWWLMIHDWNNDRFVEFLISPSGISGPFYQSTGTPYITTGSWGPIIFSRDGTRCIAVGEPNLINVFDFDRCSGLLDNAVILNTTNGVNDAIYGASLSPDGNVLYASSRYSLYQYDLTAPNINATKLILWTISDPDAEFMQHKLAPNNKIYIAMNYGGLSIPPNPVTNTYNTNLSVIHNPDVAGINCSFSPLSFSLNGNVVKGGFPNSVNYNLEPNGICNIDISEVYGTNELINISPNPSQGIINILAPSSINAELYIIDMTGRIIVKKEFNRSKTIDVSSISTGLYTVEIINADKRKSISKFLKF